MTDSLHLPLPLPPQTRRKNLVSRRDVVTVDEDRDPERRGDKEEIGTACTRSRKMINETGRTMELGRKVGLHVSFYFSATEFSNRSTRYRRTGTALESGENSRLFRKRGRLLLLSCQRFVSSSFSIDYRDFLFPFSFKAKSKLIDSW